MDLSDEDFRRNALANLGPEQIAEVVGGASLSELIALCRSVVAKLGVYELSLVKQERIKDKLLPAQTLNVVLREAPHATRIEYVDGPAKGRKVLYNAELKRGEMRVKEAGLLGFAGALWIGLDNPLAKADTNRNVTNLGYGPLLDMFEQDLKKGEAFGGFSRRELGVEKRGGALIWSAEFNAPSGARGLQVERARLSVDLGNALPLEFEGYDRGGLTERYQYQLKRQQIAIQPGFFEPKAFGL